jgi:hypothetical protein
MSLGAQQSPEADLAEAHAERRRNANALVALTDLDKYSRRVLERVDALVRTMGGIDEAQEALQRYAAQKGGRERLVRLVGAQLDAMR